MENGKILYNNIDSLSDLEKQALDIKRINVNNINLKNNKDIKNKNIS